jgi:rhamnogalacturonyl hydrolase YesR
MRAARIVLSTLLLGCVASLARAEDTLGPFPAASNPRELGNKVVDDLISREFDSGYARRGGMSYPEVCTAYGAIRFVGAMKEKDRLEKLVKRYEVFFTDEGKPLITQPNNVDNTVFGILPMEMFRQTKDTRWLDLGKPYADAQWRVPANANLRAYEQDYVNKGLTWQTRYWVDDMFMVTALQTEAFRVTNNAQYLDRAATQVAAYISRIQQPNGLFFHHEDSPFYWSRGNGWMAVGMAELLSELPADHPKRALILEGYRKMMGGLLKTQGEDGMWKQLLDQKDSWPETSGSGMFVFALATGVRNKWLDDPAAKPAAQKAWTALAGYLNPDGKVREVCEGTGRGYSVQYYEDRRRNVGDFHGQAGFIWAAYAVGHE